MICEVCGCFDEKPCESGCFWIEPNLCSACATPKQVDKAALEALNRLAADRDIARLDIDVWLLWCILCQLQLALKHPANVGPTADLVRGWMDHVVAHLPLPPVLLEMYQAGFRTDDPAAFMPIAEKR